MERGRETLIPYWLMFLVPAWLAFRRRAEDDRTQDLGPWIVVWLSFTLLIGLRYEVGGDWYGYKDFYQSVTGELIDTLTEPDPAYAALNWLSWYWGWDIYGINFVCGALASG